MLYAVDTNGNQIRASQGAVGKCPICSAPLVPKCGETNIHHWAHQSNCDPWHEPESEWHIGWKELVIPAACEVVIPPHRADIVGDNSTVIELQHSSISEQEIREREQFYGNMVWLFDARKYDLEMGKHENGYWTFRWKHARRSQLNCRKPVYWDIGRWAITKNMVIVGYGPHQIFEIKKIYDGRVAGWGNMFTKEQFSNRFMSSVLNVPAESEIPR